MTTTVPAAETHSGQRWLFDIAGMDCADCARTVEAGVRALPGVAEASVSFGAGTLEVVPASAALERESVIGAVTQAGFRAMPRGQRLAAGPWWRHRRTIEIVVSALLWAAAFALERTDAAATEWAPAALFLAAMALAGYPVARAGWFALKLRRADMNLLMTIAALGAIPLCEWEEGSSVLILFSFGLLLQNRAVERTRQAIHGLMRLAPDEATLLVDGGERRVDAASLVPGNLIVLRPGERVAADGVVISGASELDRSAITGESIPVAVGSDDEVQAGAVNGSGRLEVRVTKPASQSTVSAIIRLVEEAQASRAPAQAFVDRFATVYTPLVVTTAIVLAVAGSLWTGEVRDWVFRGLVLLVVACPCAMVISTPVALVSAIGAAARRGVLLKGGAALEALAGVRAVAFDKTGTLTHGRPAVTSIVPFGARSRDDVLALAAAVESGASHPIARGILSAARERNLPLPTAAAFRSVPGVGAMAEIDGAVITVGSPRSLESTSSAAATVAELQGRGETAVVVARHGAPIGAIGLSDPPRVASVGAIGALARMGVDSVMLTGDGARAAAAAAEQLGIDSVRAELLPAEKVAAVRELSGRGGVAMVGDGINDAPALAAASVGVAMGMSGTDVALDVADVALLADDLGRLPAAIRLSRRTMGIIRQNLAFSLVVKAAFVLLTVAGFTSLWLAVAADMGASLLVTLNALRLQLAGSAQD
jgi:Cd2+/Zn2+-exporting ATPase